MNDNIQKLYGALQKYGYNDLGTADEFGAKVQDENSRKKLYDALSRDGFNDLGTYEEFSGRLVQAPAQNTASTAPAPATTQEQAAPANPVPQDNTRWAVPEASQFGAQMDELGKSVMPGEPVSMPESKPQEPQGNPFPYRGELQKELEDLRERRMLAEENVKPDLELISEYDRRLKEFHQSLDPTSKKTKENEKWLREHKQAYEAAKNSDNMKEYASAKAAYDETARAMGSARERIAQRKNREEMDSPAEVVATGKTALGNDNIGRKDTEYMYRKLADELYQSADKEYDWSSKNDEGYKGGPLEQLWTATKQFVADAGNNIDSGSLTFGASKGLAMEKAREVGEKYNGIITDTLKGMKMSDGDIQSVLSSIESNGSKIQSLEDELNAATSEIDAMNATYEDMVRSGDPGAEAYGKTLQEKIDAYNRRVNDEYKPLFDKYDGDRKAYEQVMSAIDAAVENGLTGGEKALLDALEKFTEAKTLSEPVRSTASKAGAGAEQSAEFMLDFILTGGIAKAGTKAATKLATKRALKKFGAEALKDMAVKPGLGLRLATDAAVSGLRTAAVFPRTLQAYGENATEYSGKDYAGRIDFDRTQANALGNSLLTQFIEYWSEGFGEYFGEAEQALFKSVTKQAPREMIGKTLRNYRGSIGQYLDKGKFDGMFNEMLEEVVGSGLNALSGWLSGDRVGDAEAMKEFFSGENIATLALSFLPMSAISAATNVSAYHKMKQRYDEGVAMLNPFIESGAISRKELEQLSKDIPNLTPNEIKDRVVDIADRARNSNGGHLPKDFAKNILGYLEGDFAMSLRNDQWEDSQEKMSVVNSYATMYANPEPRYAWDIQQEENEARAAAEEAGFTQDELDLDSYQLAQQAMEMRNLEPERADALLGYANAKAALEGLENGYREQGEQIARANEEEIRSNLDVNGNVVTAVVNEYGAPKVAYITSDDVTIAPDGTVTTPTGNGVVKYRAYENGEYGPESTIMSDKVSEAQAVPTDQYIQMENDAILNGRNELYEQAKKTVSPTGQSRAISQRIGMNVVIRGNGAYQPVRVERMTDDGMKVVISGDKDTLKGVATAAQVQTPGGKYLEIDVTRLWPLLDKEADEVTLTTFEPEARTEAGAEQEQPQQAPAQATQVNQDELEDSERTIMFNGRPTKVTVNSVGGDGVWFTYMDETGTEREGDMPLEDFMNSIVSDEAPAAAEEAAEAPAPAQEQAFPVDENGNRIYDHPSVSPERAYRELMTGIEPGTRNEANRVKYIASKANKAAQAVAEAENKIAGIQAKKDAVDEWEIGEDEELDAFENRKDAKKAEYDAEMAKVQDQIAELQRIAAHWAAVRDMVDGMSSLRETASREAGLVAKADAWSQRTGVKVRICRTLEEVDNEDAKDAIEKGVAVTGWYNDDTGEVGIYLPNIRDEKEIERTFIHEVVSHKGLRELLGEDNYNILCDKVWDQLMTEEERQEFLDYNSHLKGDEQFLRRAAADEWIARLSENLDIDANRSLFDRLVDFVKEFLDRILGEDMKITKEDLQNLLKSSLANYVASTESGKENMFQKRVMEEGVGGSVQVSEGGKNQTRFSISSIATGAGMTVIKDDGNGNVAFASADGRIFNADNPITVNDLKKMKDTALSYMIGDARSLGTINRKQENIIWQAYADQLNAFLRKGVASNGLTGFDKLSGTWEWEVANSVYKSVSTNGDAQYLKSIDITRVCKKNEAVINAISEMQNRLGYGISPGQILDIYISGIEEGYQVPCPVCYVFSHYLNNGKYATIALAGQRKYGQFLVDPTTLSEEEKEARVQEWLERLRDEEDFDERNAADIEKARNDLSNIEEEINAISKRLTSGEVSDEQRQALMERATELDAQYRAALDLYSKASLGQWIKNFAIREVTDNDAPKVMGEDGKMHSQKKWVLWEDSFQGFPEQYALDLRLTAETIEKYPAIQRLRKSGGSAAGKEIHFASNNDIGDIPMMLGVSNLSDAKNYYKMAVEATTPKEREKYRKLATEKFAAARKYAQQQSLRGGQRMWSWSDNIERLAPDVFVNMLQLQLLGGALQSYSKQLEGVNLVASMGGYVNGSLMGYGKGWTELNPEDIKVVDGREVLAHDIEDTVTEKDENGNDVQRKRFLTKEGAPVFEIGGKKVTLLFDDVVGIDPYGRDGKKGLFDLNGELDKAGNIIVGMNDTHVIASMADDRVFFIIPWHASGNSTHVVMQMLSFLGAETTIEDLTDYTKVQEEKDAYKLDKNGKEKKVDQETLDLWEKFKNEKKYKVGLEGGTIPSGSKDGYLSPEQKRYRKLRDAIFAGIVEELPEKDQLAIKNDFFLSQVYRHVKNDVAAGEMTPGDSKFIYPYEYWNEKSTYDTADENGDRYLEYCRRLGHKPKFTGGYVKKTDTHYGNFAGMKGYWKLLIDRRMYGVDGKFQGLTSVTTEGYDSKLVDPEWTGQNFHVTRVADNTGVKRMVDRAIAMEETNFPGGVPTVDYDLDREEAVERHNEAAAAAEEGQKRRTEARKSKSAKKPKADKEASGTHFRVRTEPAPQKTETVYKLMRLGQDGKLYPLFIDSASPVELGTWYDADSPALKDVETLPSDTYTGRRAVKDKDGNITGYDEYKYATYLVDNETGEAMTLEEFKQKYKDGRKYSQMKGNPNAAAIDWATQNGMRWIRIEEKKTAQKRYGGSNKSYYNYGINGAGGVGTYAMRPGWHAGSLPSMRQIGKGSEKNLRDDSFVWVKGYVPADVDYNEEAQGNPDKDIPTHIPTNGYYLKATNANAEASQADRIGWYVAGSFYPDRIIGDNEAKSVIDKWNAEHPDEKVEYDWPRESGKVFNADTMRLEDDNTEPEGPDNGGGTRFRRANESQLGLVSNAGAALERIKMEKATPEQWVKMLEKEGGLKAGEDKWLGLSDWLKGLDRKTVTKDEIDDYIAEHRIQIEEVKYSESGENDRDAMEQKHPGFWNAYSIDTNWRGETGVDQIQDVAIAVDLYNRDHEDKIVPYDTGRDGRPVLTEEDYDKLMDYGDEMLNELRHINPTRLNYTTEGLDNNREIALTVPTIEPWNESDKVHFGDAGNGRAVAWIRFGETTAPAEGETDANNDHVNAIDAVDAFEDRMKAKYGEDWYDKISDEERDEERRLLEAQNDAFDRTVEREKYGNRVLVIDEIQSKRHQEGREKGYASDELKKLEKEYDEFVEETAKKHNVDVDALDDVATSEERQHAADYNNRISELRKQGGIPTAPFEKNWHELAMKRMLRLAAEEGYDYVAWTTGEQQAERYNIGSVVKKVSAGMDQERKRHTMLNVDANGMSGITTLTHDDDGNITGVSGSNTELFADAKNLADVVGKEMASDILTISEPGSANMKEYKGKDLRIGAEGMKGFYDDIIPRFMNKYGKKWGIKVSDITLPNVEEAGRTMHAVPVTQEMKDSVMEGQTMFRKSDEVDVPSVSANLYDAYENQNGEDKPWMSEQELIDRIEAELPYGIDTKELFSKIDEYRRLDEEDFDEGRRDFSGSERDAVFHEILSGLNGLAENGRAETSKEDLEKAERIAAAESIVTEKVLDSMPEAIGAGVQRVSRNDMPAGHKTDKGYYDPATNTVSVCMDNVLDERDAVATVIHETVGRKGLREIFGDQYRESMASSYAALDAEGRAWVNGYMLRNGLRPGDEGILRGMQEYMAVQAERGEGSFLDAVNDILSQAVDLSVGTEGFRFTNRELAYILRASYEHAKNPGWLDTPAGKAQDTLWKREYGINESDPNRPTDPEGPDAGTRFRRGDTGNALRDYERDMKDWRTAAVMENQNADLPVKIGYEKALKEKYGDQWSDRMKNLPENEDYLMRHNLSSSRAETESHNFMLFHFNPMLEKLREVQAKLVGRLSSADERQDAYERILDYLYAVSGLERNEWERNNGGEAKDWSGLTSLMGRPKEEWQEAEDDARAMVDAFKAEVGDDALLDQLWDAVRSCTDYSLDHAYRYGLLAKDEYERLRGTDEKPRLWNFYLPLRGFVERTAEEEYNYAGLVSTDKGNNEVVKDAKGRWTEADNPLANILNIALKEIVQGNENYARQALYRFATNLGENSLLSVRKPWYVKDASGKWSLAEPEEGQDIEAFEAEMKAKKEKKEARQGRKGLDLGLIMASKGHRNQHLIHVKVGGEDRMIWVNGNPALARAVSGIGKEPNYRLFRAGSRVISNLFTTYSIDFTAKNLLRDSIYSRVALLVKEDQPYRWQFMKNWWQNFGFGAFAFPMVRLAAMWDSGKLQAKPADKRTKREQMFIDFMTDGGQTGYTVIKSVEKIKSDIERTMRRAGKKTGPVVVPILGWYGFGVRTLNEAFELLTRFTAYQTSRDMGRTGQRAAYDAKEISVNFNRKGAQSNEGFWGQVAAYFGGTHYFYNAGIQGFDNFLRLFTKPRKGKGWIMPVTSAGIMTLGFFTPMINALLSGGGDDDDEKRGDEWYWNLPEWVRRNNIVIGWPAKKKVDENGNIKNEHEASYFCIPLPVEFRALYGLGDLTASVFAANKYAHPTPGRVMLDAVALASSVLPVNPIEGVNGSISSASELAESAVRTAVPDLTMFFVDWVTNKDYTGRALVNKSPYNPAQPASQGAFASTPKALVEVCQWIGEKTGIDVAPGLVRDFMNNYGGGYYRFAEDLAKQIFTDDLHARRWDDFPFLSGFTGHIDEDRTITYSNTVLNTYKDLATDVVKKMNLYSNSADITEKIAFEDPDALPAKAKVQAILSGKDYELAKMYYFGMKDEDTGQTEKVVKVHQKGKSAGKQYKATVKIKIPGVSTRKKTWRDLRDYWASLPDNTAEEKAAKAQAYADMTNAWHEYYNAAADLADKLMDYDYGKTE